MFLVRWKKIVQEFLDASKANEEKNDGGKGRDNIQEARVRALCSHNYESCQTDPFNPTEPCLNITPINHPMSKIDGSVKQFLVKILEHFFIGPNVM